VKLASKELTSMETILVDVRHRLIPNMVRN
jgi:hypothetical protein